ncbi:serine hydrolase [Sediminibacillus massiliensis]|uniref:serine hydrolase n=1 Tax=Sediminibacillus massiliensis TaxID=1926277 RepID=UPI0009888955|nr:serine hydrolase [Sediminibacillus massiliensis]
MKKAFLPLLSVALVSSLINPAYTLASPQTSKKNTPTQEQRSHKLSNPKAHPVFSWDSPGKISPILHPGSARGAGMMDGPLLAIDGSMNSFIDNGTMPGAVTLVARRGHIVQNKAYGHAVRYLNSSTEMDNPIKMSQDTIFDLASISKIFTTTAAMKLFEQGYFHLDDPVSEYIPEFAHNGKEKVTIRQLMTHTSGFTAWVPLYTQGENRADRLDYVFQYGLDSEPGEKYTYSDLNMITLGALVERLSGQRLDEFVKENITSPLKMTDTMYNPPASLKHRIAATEYQAVPDRGLVWGEVHDENAWSLDGVAGHAGVFSTADDLAKFAHIFLNKGRYAGKQILEPETIELLSENQIPQFPANSHGLGWELGQGWYMDALSEGSSLGHTGYTGTSITINKNNGTIAILLTNRVHPTRNTVSTNPARQQFARHVADAIPVSMPDKDGAWFSGYGSNINHNLVFKTEPGSSTLTFDTWYRTEANYDYGYVEVSMDGEKWTQLSEINGSSIDWQRQEVRLPEGSKYVRFRYDTDGSVNGRGWYVDNVQLISESDRQLEPIPTIDGWVERNY